ncbi:glutamic acid-rich protein [Drosophila novamexicana]|uniref:glutamic acid-rich protein n=1 Tax=Drosophila novamexicana TaxID=47314 RepID=UPI0011E5FE17|nr:glutamic acid-rich protein [Drosophila novamexicana]
MSTQRGNASRTRAQKHKNRHVFKNDLHDKTPQQIRLNKMHVSTVCQRCKEVIEWKIKYKKYKPLTQAKTCARCQQRTVRKAYHVICRDCAVKDHVCAKCLKSADEVAIEAPEPTPQEEQQLQVEMDRLIKSFPERKRRAFLRFMAKGRKQETEEPVEDEEREAQEKATRVRHTREELLEKIKQLNLAEEDDDYNDDEDEDEDEDEDGDGEGEGDSDVDSDECDSEESSDEEQQKPKISDKLVNK